VSRLSKRGLVKRTSDHSDGRYCALHLREPGRRLLRRVSAYVEAQERAMDAVLRRGERAQMLDCLQRITRVFAR